VAIRTWQPERYKVLRQAVVLTIEGHHLTQPRGYAEVDGAMFIMPRDRIRLRVADGEVDRLVRSGEMRALSPELRG
jgi:hypothetical protein